MDIQQLFGNDISLDGTGNLSVSSGSEQAKEAIVRRLLTNPGDYIWHPDYGAGIGRFVGENLSTANYDEIRSTIVSQILLEETVAKNPVPQISFKALPGNILQASVVYYDAIDNVPKSISFNFQGSSNATSN
jgi:hypothetical protein